MLIKMVWFLENHFWKAIFALEVCSDSGETALTIGYQWISNSQPLMSTSQVT